MTAVRRAHRRGSRAVRWSYPSSGLCTEEQLLDRDGAVRHGHIFAQCPRNWRTGRGHWSKPRRDHGRHVLVDTAAPTNPGETSESCRRPASGRPGPGCRSSRGSSRTALSRAKREARTARARPSIPTSACATAAGRVGVAVKHPRSGEHACGIRKNGPGERVGLEDDSSGARAALALPT